MNELLLEGVSVMLIGVGTVMAFLCLMICLMYLMSALVKKLNKIFPEVVPAQAGAVKKATSGDDSEIAAAIVAAIFRK